MSEPVRSDPTNLPPATAAFYREAMRTLERAQVPFLVGGAYAYERYTGIARHTKDLDVFLRPADVAAALTVLTEAGYDTELTFPHWLAKAHAGEDSLDLIFSSGNGVVEVDDAWFVRAPAREVLGVWVRACPVEEMIWSKAFVMERERFDGGDILHLLHSSADDLDWEHLLKRFGPYWRVLLSHLILFGFVYPSARHRIPRAVLRGLLERLQMEEAQPPPDTSLCLGTLLSRAQYLVDIERWGYEDARLHPPGAMTSEAIASWTDAIEDKDRPG